MSRLCRGLGARSFITFKKDVKLAKKRGLDMSELRAVLVKLCTEEPLEERYRDRALTGNHVGFRECHIRPDWLLIDACHRLA